MVLAALEVHFEHIRLEISRQQRHSSFLEISSDGHIHSKHRIETRLQQHQVSVHNISIRPINQIVMCFGTGPLQAVANRFNGMTHIFISCIHTETVYEEQLAAAVAIGFSVEKLTRNHDVLPLGHLSFLCGEQFVDIESFDHSPTDINVNRGTMLPLISAVCGQMDSLFK